MADQVLKSWRRPNHHRPARGKPDPFPATQVFDNLYFIGNSKFACYVVSTSEGLLMLDCMTCDPDDIPYIEREYRDLGLDITQLKAILITHGHGDHYGRANLLRERYGAKIYMSKVDFDYAQAANDPDSVFPDGPLTWDVDGYLEEGSFTLGATTITVAATPGHTRGCLSFIVPVFDEGRPHRIALWGGTGVPAKREYQEEYLASCDRFARLTDELGVDGEITNHPYVDSTILRLSVLRGIVDGVPNPFVLGKEGYKYFESYIRDNCLRIMNGG